MRYLYFRIRFGQYFKAENGISGFAEQVVTWIVGSFLKLANALLKKNTVLKEKIEKAHTEQERREKLPKYDDVAFSNIKDQVFRFTAGKYILIAGEFVFSYYAFSSILRSDEWPAILGRVLLALLFTYGIIIAFEKLFEEIFNEPEDTPGTEPVVRKRSTLKLIFYALLCIILESILYYISIVRGLEIEGSHGSGTITIILAVIGMIAPILAGWFDYMRSRIIGAYHNTKRLKKLTAEITEFQKSIALNLKTLRLRFEKSFNNGWAVLSEFKVYKKNYNRKRSIEDEDLTSHFAENQAAFRAEIVNRLSDEIDIYTIVKSQKEDPKILPPGDNHKPVSQPEIKLLRESNTNPPDTNNNNPKGEDI